MRRFLTTAILSLLVSQLSAAGAAPDAGSIGDSPQAAIVTLTMSVPSPLHGGSTEPTIGQHSVSAGAATAVKATAAAGYFFSSWSLSGFGWIDDPLSASTTVTLSSGATITATFGALAGYAALAVTASPEGAGSTSPAAGASSFPSGSAMRVSASPSEGYFFKRWIVSGGGLLGCAYSPITTLALNGDTTLVAEFSSVSGMATLTMSVLPEGAGSVSPSGGQYAVPAGGGVALRAFPSVGYLFWKWEVGDAVRIDNAFSPEAVASLSADGVVVARFVKESGYATLTMSVSPGGAGATVPATGSFNVPTGVPVELLAIPYSGWCFAGWTATNSALIIDPSAPSTSVIISGGTTVAPVFYPLPVEFMAVGASTRIAASEIGDGSLAKFTQKPSFWASYTDPVSKVAGKKAALTVLTKVDKSAPQEAVEAQWSAKILLYSRQVYCVSDAPKSDRIIGRPIPGLVAESVMAKSSEIGMTGRQVADRTMALACPSVSLIRGAPEVKGDEFVVEGMFFGAVPPKCYIECKKPVTSAKQSFIYQYTQCGIVSKETLLYRDAKGKASASCMKIFEDDIRYPAMPEPVGYSEVTLTYPKLVKNYIATGYLIIDNGVGLAAFPIPAE